MSTYAFPNPTAHSFHSLLQESPDPIDRKRCFILSYFLSTDMISIYEPPVRNSGIIGGKYLGKTKVPKPGSTVENPTYYEPADLTIGATVKGGSGCGPSARSEHLYLRLAHCFQWFF